MERTMDELKTLAASAADLFGPFVPRLLAALGLLLVAWVAARIVAAAIARAAAAARIDERTKSAGLSRTLAGVGSAAVWLLALPALLGALGIEALLAPVNAMLARLLGFLPNLLGAVIIFGVGFMVARTVRDIVTGLLTAAGSEKLAERLGLSSALGDKTLAGLLASIVFALILLPTVAAALQPLGVDAVTQPVSKLLDSVMQLIPRLLSATIILVVAAVIGRTLAGLLTTALAAAGFDKLPALLGAASGPRLGNRTAAEWAGLLLVVAVVYVGALQATEIIGLPVLTSVVASLGGVLARIGVGLVVFGVGLWLARVAADAVVTSRVANAATLSMMARVAVLFFAAALALVQAGLPSEIVTILFASVVGAVTIGFAIAAGIGGRGVAQRLLEAAEQSFTVQPEAPTPTDALPPTEPPSR
jgi:hypothetical protein